MANKHNLKVGDRLFIVWRTYQYASVERTQTLAITKVDRKFAYMGTVQVSLETLEVGRSDSGQGFSGRAHLCEKAYRAESARVKAHTRLLEYLKKLNDFGSVNRYPFTTEQILHAAEILGIPRREIITTGESV